MSANGTINRAEMLRRYLSMDETLRPVDLAQRLKKEHGLVSPTTECSKARRDYFSSIGKKCPDLRGRPHIKPAKPRVKEGKCFDSITFLNLLHAAKEVGGIKSAIELLTLVQEVNQ